MTKAQEAPQGQEGRPPDLRATTYQDQRTQTTAPRSHVLLLPLSVSSTGIPDLIDTSLYSLITQVPSVLGTFSCTPLNPHHYEYICLLLLGSTVIHRLSPDVFVLLRFKKPLSLTNVSLPEWNLFWERSGTVFLSITSAKKRLLSLLF